MKREVETLKNYINGNLFSLSKDSLDVINPFTEEVITRITDSDEGMLI